MARRRDNGNTGAGSAGEYVKLENRLVLVAWRIAYFIVLAMIKPEVAPRLTGVTWGERIGSLWRILPLLLLAMFMFGALYTGMATPSEVAGVGAFAAIIICLAYR